MAKRLTEEEKKKRLEAKEFEKIAKMSFYNHDFAIILPEMKGIAVVTDQSQNHSGILVMNLETDEIIDQELFLLEEIDFIIAAKKIYEKVKEYLIKYKPAFLGLEAAFYSRLHGADKFEKLTFVKNKLIELAYDEQIQVSTVPPIVWKQPLDFVGDYKQQKLESIKLANEIIGKEVFTNDDLADSYHIYRYLKRERVHITNE